MSSQEPNFKLQVRPTIRPRSPRELLVFSLDDTLLDTSLYWQVRAAFARAVAAKTGEKDERILKTYEAWPASTRFGPRQDSVTIQETWVAFQQESGITAGDGDQDLYMLVATLLRRKFPSPIPGAEDLLKWAQSHFTLALILSGDPEVERRKLEDSNLGLYFKAIKYVPAKTGEDYLALFSELGFSPRNVWAIGSSAQSDLNPAMAAGTYGILYTPRKQSGAQETSGELTETGFRIHDLSDARSILAK